MGTWKNEKQSATKEMMRGAVPEWGRLYGVLRGVRNDYKRSIDDAVKTRREATESAKKRFIGEELKRQIQEIDSSYSAAVGAAKARARETADEAFSVCDKAFHREIMASPDEGALRMLNSLGEMPLDSKELELLSDRYGGQNYIIDRKLVALAQRNAVDLSDAGLTVRPSMGQRYTVLDELRSEVDGLIEHYSPDAVCLELSDLRLEIAQKRMTNGFYNGYQDAEDRARSILTMARAAGRTVDTGMILGNGLKNLDDSARLELLSMLAEDSGVSDISLKVAGIDAEVRAFRGDKEKSYKTAKQIYQEAERVSAENLAEVMAELMENRNNEFLIERMSKGSATNERIKALCDRVNREAGEEIISVASD